MYNANQNGIDAAHSESVTISNCRVINSGENGIRFTGSSDVSTRIRGSSIIGCTVRGSRGQDGIVIHEASNGNDPAKPMAGVGFTIRDNISTDNKENGFDITTGSNVLLYGNTSARNGQGGILIGHTANQVEVTRHYALHEPIEERGATVRIASPNVLIQDSILIGSQNQTKPVILVSPGTDGESLPDRIVINNNTLLWANAVSGSAVSISKLTDPVFPIRDLRFTNNIVGSLNASANGYISIDGVDRNNQRMIFDWNYYHAPNGTAALFNVSFSDLQSFSFTRTQLQQLRDSLRWELNSPNTVSQEAPANVFVNLAVGEDRATVDLRLKAMPRVKNLGRGFWGDSSERKDFSDTVTRSGPPDSGAYEEEETFLVQSPANVLVIPLTPSRILVSWRNYAANATGFNLNRRLSNSPSEPWQLVNLDPVPGANATLADHDPLTNSATSIAPGTEYDYQVRARVSADVSLWSPFARGKTIVSGTPPPPPVVQVVNRDEVLTLQNYSAYAVSGLSSPPIKRLSVSDGTYGAVQYLVDGVKVSPLLAVPPFNFDWDARAYGTPTGGASALQMTAIAYSTADLATSPASYVNFTASATPTFPVAGPSVQIVSQDEKMRKVAVGSKIKVDTSLSPEEAPLQKVVFSFSGDADLTQFVDSVAPFEYTIPSGVTGSPQVEVIAIDGRGNYARTKPLMLEAQAGSNTDFVPPSFRFGLGSGVEVNAGSIRGVTTFTLSNVSEPGTVSFKCVPAGSTTTEWILGPFSTAVGDNNYSWNTEAAINSDPNNPVYFPNGSCSVEALVRDIHGNEAKATFTIRIDNLGQPRVKPYVKILPIAFGLENTHAVALGMEEETPAALSITLRGSSTLGVIVKETRGTNGRFNGTLSVRLIADEMDPGVAAPSDYTGPGGQSFQRVGNTNVFVLTGFSPPAATAPGAPGYYRLVITATRTEPGPLGVADSEVPVRISPQ